MSGESRPKNVLIWGAGGDNIGYWLVKILASDTRFTVTVLARSSSKSNYPSNVKIVRIDESLPRTDLVSALKGQDVVVSCVGPAAKSQEKLLIEAAIEAKVQRFFPSDYGLDNTNPKAREMSPIFDGKGQTIEYLRSVESTGLTWTSLATGLWIDWSLDPKFPFALIDIQNQTATYYNGGTHKLSWSTLPSAADSIRLILLHPDQSLTANKVVKISNLEASQVDIVTALEELQGGGKGVKYTISSDTDKATLIRENKTKIAESKGTDMEAMIDSVRIGLLTEGQGSNFKTEGQGEGLINAELGVPQFNLEDVVRDALAQYGVN